MAGLKRVSVSNADSTIEQYEAELVGPAQSRCGIKLRGPAPRRK